LIHEVGVSLNTTVCPLLFLIYLERKFANLQLIVTENVQNFKHSKNVLTPLDSMVLWRIKYDKMEMCTYILTYIHIISFGRSIESVFKRTVRHDNCQVERNKYTNKAG